MVLQRLQAAATVVAAQVLGLQVIGSQALLAARQGKALQLLPLHRMGAALLQVQALRALLVAADCLLLPAKAQ